MNQTPMQQKFSKFWKFFRIRQSIVLRELKNFLIDSR